MSEFLNLLLKQVLNECKSDDDIHEIQCQVSEIYNVKKELEKEISNFISTEIEWIPINSVKISKKKMMI